ncbi:sulfite exporter TauE/SafE family protein [Actibacterium sp. 188UL27-1]|uniref:sulfite exporter TauE/SafE family protein n=1 Tax=Actibacterium sp. 188UL27-1 TaxID=2786961 RepID=UPI0019580260|nr:sulfite exporter TauE/SafE family protein [Actibacterium sp. 188UL27-1]MBM7066551.1 sulfite exporter TauE/SafE family protein [Actibacterium sp. 188UL27-1]
MMMPDPIVLAVAVPAVLFAGISKGGFGSGAAFAATPILSLVVEPLVALGIMLPLLMLVDVVTVNSFWKRWHLPSVKVLILGGLPGVAIGAYLSQVADADVFRILIGALSLAFVAYQLARARGWLNIPDMAFSPRWGLFTGMTAGFTSYVSHAGGPPVAMFLIGQGMTKTMYQATTAITFWGINIMKFVPYAILGVFTAETLLIDVWMAPVAVAGAYLGIYAHKLVPERIFFAITYVLLITTGSKLIWDALT